MSSKTFNPGSTACLSCREKHLKCDGQTPVCGRCVATATECVWVQSRRGRRAGPRTLRRPAVGAQTQARAQAQLQPQAQMQAQTQIPPTIVSQIPSDVQRELPGPSDMPRISTPDTFTGSALSPSEDTISLPAVPNDVFCPDEEQLIDLYYKFIHPAHPFALPRLLYSQNPEILPKHVRTAMCYIASHHSTSLINACESWRDASQMVFSPNIPEDGFKVQALVLITLASFARFERDRGLHALRMAIDVARRIGLDSSTYGRGQELIVQESWRRTWWELYSIAGLISLISGSDLRLDQPANMTVPYACDLYDSCQTTLMGTVEDVKQRSLSDSSIPWSSFAYRIEAMRILSCVLDISSGSPSAQCDAAAASISGYLLSLPAEKCEGLQPNGEADEVMICALMIIHLASISLNLPRSPLSQLRGFQTVCGNMRGQAASDTPRTSETAAVRSAKAITKLISAHSTLRSLSPCFSCAIAFSAVVLLSEYLVRPSRENQFLKEGVQLELMALKSLSEVWPIARVVRGQIAQFSREVLNVPPSAQAMDNGEAFPALDVSMQNEQWLQELIDENLMPGDTDLSMFNPISVT